MTSSAGGRRRRAWSRCRGPRSRPRAAPAPCRARAGPRAAAPARPIPRPRHRRRSRPACASSRRDLQQQRRLADAGVAADQHRRSGHDPAADRAVELGDPARQSARAARPRRVEPDQLDRPAAALEVMLGREDARHLGRFLDQRVPLGAVGALPLPAVRDRPAGLADVAGLWLRHRPQLSGTNSERKGAKTPLRPCRPSSAGGPAGSAGRRSSGTGRGTPSTPSARRGSPPSRRAACGSSACPSCS